MLTFCIRSSTQEVQGSVTLISQKLLPKACYCKIVLASRLLMQELKLKMQLYLTIFYHSVLFRCTTRIRNSALVLMLAGYAVYAGISQELLQSLLRYSKEPDCFFVWTKIKTRQHMFSEAHCTVKLYPCYTPTSVLHFACVCFLMTFIDFVAILSVYIISHMNGTKF